MSTTVATLEAPFNLPCGTTLPNRLAKAAMSEQLSDRENRPTKELERLYARWGDHGAGLVITGNVMVDRRQLGEPRNVVVEDDRDLEALKRWADAGQAHGARLWMQINHPGRQAMPGGGVQAVAPSAAPPAMPGIRGARELTGDEILEIVERFATTAELAKRAGFSGVQLHGAHGYLISQFLSPRVNKRDDDWGGDAIRRRRFALEVYRAVRAAVDAEFPVAIKLNSTDFLRGGLDEDESAATVAALFAEGVDLVEVSGGTYEAPAMIGRARQQKASTREREAYFLEFADRLRAELPELPLMVTGGFRSRVAMEAAIAAGACDIVGVARPLALVPDGAAQLLSAERGRIDAGKPHVRNPKLQGAVDLYWHTRQLQRVGRGRRPNPRERGWRTALAFMADNGWNAFRRKRGF